MGLRKKFIQLISYYGKGLGYTERAQLTLRTVPLCGPQLGGMPYSAAKFKNQACSGYYAQYLRGRNEPGHGVGSGGR